MEHTLECSLVGNGHNSIVSDSENEQKLLQPSDTSLKDALDAGPSLQSNVLMTTCSTGDCVGDLPVLLPGDLSIESVEDEKNVHQYEELLAEEKALGAHEMEGKEEIDEIFEDYASSSCPPLDQITLQEQGTEGSMLACELMGDDDSLDKMDAANTCHQEETLVEKSSLASVTCTIDGGKIDSQLVFNMGSEILVERHNEVGNLEEVEVVPDFTEEASKEAQFVDTKAIIPENIGCEEGNCYQICDSGSPIAYTEPKIIDDQDAQHMAASEAECIVLQESLSESLKEIKKEDNVGSTDCARDDSGASALSVDGSKVAYMEENVPKHLEESSNSVFHSECKRLADAAESTKPAMKDDCNVGNENALDQRWVVADTNGEDCASSGNMDSTVEVSKVCLGESTEEDYASYDDEAAKVCLSASSSIRSITSQVGIMEEQVLNGQSSVDDKNVGVDAEGGQTEDGAGSSECQHHGFTVDKDGGSSLDSTAGTGQQQSDECTPLGDEEVRSMGGEDTASSPAFVQPLTRQRKKINIHHQFVREIVKIQHGREQYDREQAERQFQAQQAASLPQIGFKSSDIKEEKNNLEMRDVRDEPNKLQDLGAHRQDSQQKQSTRNKKSSMIQSRNGPSHYWSSPIEQSPQAFSQAMGAKEQGKIGRGKQQRSMSLYRPPVVRESLAAEQRNQGEPETYFHQSGAYAINSSPDSLASSFSESRATIAGLPSFMNEGPPKVVQSSSEECYGDNIETQAEHSTPGMGIKVTFDTEKRQRHIQFSDEPDSFSRGEHASPAASHSSSGYGVSKGPKFNPSLSHPYQDSKVPSGSRQQIDHNETPSKGTDRHFTQATRSVNPSLSHPFQDSNYASASRQIDHGETPSKGNDRHYTQAARSSSSSLSQPFQDSKSLSGSRQQIAHGETPSKGNDRHFTQAARSINPSLSHPLQDSRFSSGSRQIDHGETSSKGYDRHFTQLASSVNPLLGHPLHQDSRFSSGSRQVDHGETPFKGNDRHLAQAARSGSLQGFSSAQPSQNRGRAGKSSDKMTERKSSFFERADNSANLHNSSSWMRKSPPSLIKQGTGGQTGQSISNDSSRRSDWYAGTPIPSSQSFATPSSQRTASLGASYEGEFFGSPSFATVNVRSEDYDRTPMNMHANFQQQLFNSPRSHDHRGNQRYAISESREGKKDSQQKGSVKEYSSPFQAMMKEMSRPQAVFSPPAQRSADVNLDSKEFGGSRHAKDHTQMHSQDTSQESLRRSQSDASRKGYAQNPQAQATPLPSRESLFCAMPMQEKWGDIVDDLTDSYEYLQIKNEGGRETQLGNLSYGASNAGSFDAKFLKPVIRDSKQDRGMPKYSFKETTSSQKHTDLAREHVAYETPSRKSVFERLGPQNNFQESILGPPPIMLENRGVLKASPDALISNVPPLSTYKSVDSGFYGSQWGPQPQLPSVQHENADNIFDEGREVVVQAYTEMKQRRSKRELYVPRRGS